MAAKETVVETVTMLDGRVVDFPGKRRLLKESFINDGKVVVKFDFRNGEARQFTIPAELLLKFAAHGAEQKFGDETAGLDDIDDAVLAIDNLMDRLNEGKWGIERQSNGMAGTSILVRALVESTGKAVEVIKGFLSNKSHAEKVALRGNPKIKPIVERLEAEKAAKSTAKNAVDTDGLLAELG